MAPQSHVLTITGMTCDGCSGRLANVLRATPGVIDAKISHQTDSGSILTDESLSTHDLVAIVNETGFVASI
jgi:copper chaperone CopZ